MIYLSYFIIIFLIIQFIVSLINLIFNQKIENSKSNFDGLVSVLIPARNEEQNIATILTDLQNQNYQNIEILVFNDQSTDKTEDIVKQFSENDKRIKVINSTGLPDNWLGKNFGCYSLAKIAKGEYFLFLDADVRVYKNIIINTIQKAEQKNLGLLSIFPKQIMLSLGEKITIPNMNFILLTLLPLILVYKSKFQSLSAANGQFMLFNSKIYKLMQPHEKMKSKKVEDIEIARFYKQNNIKIACLTGNNSISCRMYQNFGEATNGFSKNVLMFFGNSFFVALFFWLITSFGFIIIYFNFDLKIFLLYLFITILTRIFVSITSKQNIFTNLILAIPQQISLGIFIFKALINKQKKQFKWKGRNIS